MGDCSRCDYAAAILIVGVRAKGVRMDDNFVVVRDKARGA